MLRIRKEQMDVLQAEALRDFEKRVADHARLFFPAECKALGEDTTREIIGKAGERAASHAIVSERDLCLYADLMLILGPEFDAQLPWAHDILKDREVRPARRLDLLFSELFDDTDEPCTGALK